MQKNGVTIERRIYLNNSIEALNPLKEGHQGLLKLWGSSVGKKCGFSKK